MIGQVLQAGLAAELGAHLEDPGGDGGGNRRNGSSVKTLNTEVGPVRLAVPRDRDGGFVPALVPKQATRSDGLNAVIISLYAKGMSVRDIARHVRQTAGVGTCRRTRFSRVTDARAGGDAEWRRRPLELFYPVIYIDALVAKVRDGSAVDENKAVNIAVGIDDCGAKRVLGIWVASAEGAKAWAQALAQLRRPGPGGSPVRLLRRAERPGRGDHGDVAGRHGADLRGAPDTGGSLNYASYNGRKAMAAGLRAVYSACDADAAYARGLADLSGTPPWGRSTRPRSRSGNGPGTVSSRSWNTARGAAEVLYTTNAIVISSLN